ANLSGGSSRRGRRPRLGFSACRIYQNHRSPTRTVTKPASPTPVTTGRGRVQLLAQKGEIRFRSDVRAKKDQQWCLRRSVVCVVALRLGLRASEQFRLRNNRGGRSACRSA